ncbi:MAG: Flp family type IVb pilin [Bryobacteraceae bacterium]
MQLEYITTTCWVHSLNLWRDRRAQDMIEYALLAAFLAVAVAAFFPLDIAPNISTVFSRVTSYLNAAP